MNRQLLNSTIEGTKPQTKKHSPLQFRILAAQVTPITASHKNKRLGLLSQPLRFLLISC